MQRTNAERAEKAYRAVLTYERDSSVEECISDLLGDLRHLCDQSGYDYAERDGVGYRNYRSEVGEEREQTREQRPVAPQTSQPCECGSEMAGIHYPTATDGDGSRAWIERCDLCQVYESDQEAAEALVRDEIIPAFALARAGGCQSFTPYATTEEGVPLNPANVPPMPKRPRWAAKVWLTFDAADEGEATRTQERLEHEVSVAVEREGARIGANALVGGEGTPERTE